MNDIDRLNQAKQLLKDVGNNGNDLSDREFENNDNCEFDNIYIAIKKIDKAIEIILNFPEYRGN